MICFRTCHDWGGLSPVSRSGDLHSITDRICGKQSDTETDFFQHHSASTHIVFIYQRCCDLKRGSTAARLLGLRVRIPPRACIYVSCECCVLWSRGLCVGPITPSEESYRAWCITLAIDCVVKQNISPGSNQDYRFMYKRMNNVSQITCLKRWKGAYQQTGRHISLPFSLRNEDRLQVKRSW